MINNRMFISMCQLLSQSIESHFLLTVNNKSPQQAATPTYTKQLKLGRTKMDYARGNFHYK